MIQSRGKQRCTERGENHLVLVFYRGFLVVHGHPAVFCGGAQDASADAYTAPPPNPAQ